jgi:hypothetical protein
VNLIHRAQDADRWCSNINRILNFGPLRGKEFSDQLNELKVSYLPALQPVASRARWSRR